VTIAIPVGEPGTGVGGIHVEEHFYGIWHAHWGTVHTFVRPIR